MVYAPVPNAALLASLVAVAISSRVRANVCSAYVSPIANAWVTGVPLVLRAAVERIRDAASRIR